MPRPTGRVMRFSKTRGSRRVGSGRVGSGRVGPGWVGSGTVGYGRVGSGRVGSGRVGSGRVGSGRVGSGRVGSCGVRNITVGSNWVRSFSNITSRAGSPWPDPMTREKSSDASWKALRFSKLILFFSAISGREQTNAERCACGTISTRSFYAAFFCCVCVAHL